MTHSLPLQPVLGVPLHVIDYAGAVRAVEQLATAADGRVRCVAAANTHLVGEAATNPDFAEVLQSFDLIVPDGMPLVWCMRLDGAEIHDRVYGPYLMKAVLAASGNGLRHYFFGGTEETLAALKSEMLRLNPELVIAGSCSPPFGSWSAEQESAMLSHIHDSGANCIWVALGGVKQESWMHRVRGRLTQGVMLAVGDAFVLNAGLRAYAPDWMQRCGLTWLWRLCQEPGRLAQRYARYHGRFVWAYLKERWALTWH